MQHQTVLLDRAALCYLVTPAGLVCPVFLYSQLDPWVLLHPLVRWLDQLDPAVRCCQHHSDPLDRWRPLDRWHPWDQLCRRQLRRLVRLCLMEALLVLYSHVVRLDLADR